MSKGNPKALFTPNFIRLIKLARELNENRKISGDIYFHPVEAKNKIVVKTIDLNLTNPLCEVNSRTKDNRDWEERWLEAYLINRAKKNKWELDLAGKKHRFLASQFTFRAGPSLRVDGRQYRHVDLLLYDEEKKCLVVLELKKQADKSSLCEAKNELVIYVNEINRLIENEEKALEKAFDLEKGVKDVIGYIVCPKSDRVIQERALGEFRLIQYTKPWKNFEDVKESGRKMEIKFTCRPPTR